MTTVAQAKKFLLSAMASELSRCDDHMPDEVNDDVPEEYARWTRARDQLIAESHRRASPPSSTPENAGSQRTSEKK